MTTTHRGTTLIIWLVVFTTLVVLSLVGRFWAAHIQRRAWRLDDALIIFAFANLLALEIPTFITYNNNLGAHTNELSPSEIVLILKVLYSASITWTLATSSCKLAVLLLYLTIFPSKRFRIAVYIVMGLEVAFLIAFLPIFLTICSPPRAFWSLNPADQAKCHPIQDQQYASVAANLVLDLIVVVLPMPAVWNLQLPIRKKIFVTLMFSLGLTIVGVMCWRLYTTWFSTTTKDWAYVIVTTALQSHLELLLGILAANLPTMGQLLQKWAVPMSSVFSRLRSNFSQGTKDSSKVTEISDKSKLSSNSRKNFSKMSARTSGESMEIPLGTVSNAHADNPESEPFNPKSSPKIWRGFEVRVHSTSRDENSLDENNGTSRQWQ